MIGRFVVFCAITLCAIQTAFSTPPTPADCTQNRDPESCQLYRVDVILIEGHFRTKREVFERELLFSEGDVATVAEVHESIQRLRNTGLFRTVDYELVAQPIASLDAEKKVVSDVEVMPEARILRVHVDERWTILPAVRYDRGGSTSYFMLGIQDVNFLGRYLQVGAQYERLANAHSGNVWFRNPRFLQQRLMFSTNLVHSNRVLTFYENSGQLDGGYLRTRSLAGLSLDKEWVRWLRTGIGVSLYHDSFSYRLISNIVQDAQDEAGGLPDSGMSLSVGVSTRLGRLDYNNYLVEGSVFQLRLNREQSLSGHLPNVTRGDVSVLRFWTLPLKSTVGVRYLMGMSNAEQGHQLYYIGGLDAVRGFLNMRYRGKHFWLANAEYRIPSLDRQWLALQHIFFVDAAGVSPYFSQLFDVTASSAGIGLRIISPKIYSLVMRIDYAFPLTGDAGPGLSLGAHQFF